MGTAWLGKDEGHERYRMALGDRMASRFSQSSTSVSSHLDEFSSREDGDSSEQRRESETATGVNSSSVATSMAYLRQKVFLCESRHEEFEECVPTGPSETGLVSKWRPKDRRFKTPLFLKLVLGLCWWMIHLFLGIHQFGSHLFQVIESYIISIGLLKSYRHLQLDKLRCLAVLIDSKEARDTLKIKKLLRWFTDIGVNYVILYDMEGVLKKSLNGNLSEFTGGVTSVPQKDRMIIELLSFADKKGIARAASFLCTKYMKDQFASCDKKVPNITETEMFDALNAVGCGGPEPNLLLVYGPVRCHLGFPAWRLRYTEIVHMGSLKSMKYGSILKAFFEFSKKQQNYGT